MATSPQKPAPPQQSKLRTARLLRGLTQQQLAQLAGTSQPQIDRLETGKRKLSIDWMVRLAPHLGVSPIDLSDALAAQLGDRGGKRIDLSSVVLPPPPRGGMGSVPGQIPVRSAARGGKGQEMFLSDGPIGYTARPASLAGVREAYAIYMTGDSMEPRYFSGWLLHVNPFKPPVRGRDTVVYKVDNTVMVKEFVRRDNNNTVVRQLNPKQDIKIPNREIRETHLVVGSDQEG